MFKPKLIPTITTLCAFFLLVYLGVWQVKRLYWKNSLISTMNEKIAMPPVSVDDVIKDVEGNKYRKIELKGEFLHNQEKYLFVGKRSARSLQGFDILTPFKLENGEVVLVDRGWIDADRKKKNMRSETLVKGTQKLVGMVHKGEKKGKWTPENDAEKNFWFWIDLQEIKENSSITQDDFYVRLVKNSNDNSYPIAGDTVIRQRNDHLQYAITWFVLAITSLVIYFVYHRSQRQD